MSLLLCLSSLVSLLLSPVCVCVCVCVCVGDDGEWCGERYRFDCLIDYAVVVVAAIAVLSLIAVVCGDGDGDVMVINCCYCMFIFVFACVFVYACVCVCGGYSLRNRGVVMRHTSQGIKVTSLSHPHTARYYTAAVSCTNAYTQTHM